jgi:hypothetical protein
MAEFSISDLGNLQPADPIDLTELAPKGPAFPRKGRYILRVPETLDPAFTFGSTKAGNLSATIDPTIVGPTNEGYTVRFVKMSAKVYNEKVYGSEETRQTSQMAQFLAACGDKRALTGDPEQAVEAVLEQVGKEFPAALDWRAYNKRTGEAVEGMENFTPDGNGGYLPWVLDEGDLDDNGKPKRIRANITVRRFYPVR